MDYILAEHQPQSVSKRLLIGVNINWKKIPPDSFIFTFFPRGFVFFENGIDWTTTTDRPRGDIVKSGYSALEVTWLDSWCGQLTFTLTQSYNNGWLKLSTLRIRIRNKKYLFNYSSLLPCNLRRWSELICFAMLLPYGTLERIIESWYSLISW